MTSLLDIGPLTETVVIGGKDIEVAGLTPEGFFYLMHKFPALQAMFGKDDITAVDLMEVAPDSIAYALALVTTDRSEFNKRKDWVKTVEKAAKTALKLPAHFQMQLFQAGLRVSFPDGFGPFMQAVVATAQTISTVSGKTESVMTSSKPSRSGFSTDSTGMRLGRAAPSANSMH